jgi:hypothetical protein
MRWYDAIDLNTKNFADIPLTGSREPKEGDDSVLDEDDDENDDTTAQSLLV